MVEDGLLEGFEVGGLGGLECLQGLDFLGKCVELFDDFLLLGQRLERDFRQSTAH